MSTPAKQHPDRPDAAGFVRAALAAALAQVQSHLAVLEGGGSDAETIHQLRVALRRLRMVVSSVSKSAIVPNSLMMSW